MSLLTMIDEIDTLVTNSAPIPTVKPKLYTLREQAQALERHITLLETKYDALQIAYDKEVLCLKQQIADLKKAKSVYEPNMIEVLPDPTVLRPEQM